MNSNALPGAEQWTSAPITSKAPVLVIEDDAPQRELLSRWLKGSFDVAVAEDGRSARYRLMSERWSLVVCDLRLPLPTMPPVAAQISRKSNVVAVRRVSPGLPVYLNSTPLSTNEPTPLRQGDRLDVGGVEIMLVLPAAGFVSPKLVSAEVNSPPQVLEPKSSSESSRREAELARRERELHEQAEELKADRVLWYRRREQMEKELEQQRADVLSPGSELAKRAADLDARERDFIERVAAAQADQERQRQTLAADRVILEKIGRAHV